MAAAGSLALAHDALLPRAPGGMGAGAALALVVHVGLVLALTTAVDWRTETPPPVSAELWASVPQSAPLKAEVPAPAPPSPSPAPSPSPPPPPVLPTPTPPPAPPVAVPAPVPAPAPPPAPPVAKAPEPDIAIEKAAREKAVKAEQAKRKVEADALAERERVAAEKQKRAAADKADKAEKAEKAERAEKAEKAQADKLKAEKAQADKVKADKAEKAAAEKEAREAAAEDARLAKQREENLKRMMGQAGGATGRGGSATQEAAPSAAYAGKVAARIRRELVFTGNVPESAEAEVLVVSTAIGNIMNKRITKSSGYKDWDEAVLRAVDKTGTLPRDVDGRVPKEMTLVFRRRDQ